MNVNEGQMNPESFFKQMFWFFLLMGFFFPTSFATFQPFVNVGIYLTQAIVEGKVHIITDAIYVVCLSSPRQPVSSCELQFIPNRSPKQRIRLHLQVYLSSLKYKGAMSNGNLKRCY